MKGSYNIQGDFIVDDPDGNGRQAWSSDYYRELTKAEFNLEPGNIAMERPLAGDYQIEMTVTNAAGPADDPSFELTPSIGQLTIEVTPGVTYVPNCEVVSLRFGREFCTCEDGDPQCLRTAETYEVYLDDDDNVMDDATLATYTQAELTNMTTEERTRRNPDTCWNVVNPKTRFEVRIRTRDIAGNYRRAGGDTIQAAFVRNQEWCEAWSGDSGGGIWNATGDEICEAIDLDRQSPESCVCDALPVYGAGEVELRHTATVNADVTDSANVILSSPPDHTIKVGMLVTSDFILEAVTVYSCATADNSDYCTTPNLVLSSPQTIPAGETLTFTVCNELSENRWVRKTTSEIPFCFVIFFFSFISVLVRNFFLFLNACDYREMFLRMTVCCALYGRVLSGRILGMHYANFQSCEPGTSRRSRRNFHHGLGDGYPVGYQ
eukprot:SAG31_NODE_672_length_12933_cov_3.746143_11_plen_435_part_00